MEFKDFENNKKELIGKSVLYEQETSYSENTKRLILKIDSVTKTGFRLFSMPDTLFDFNGHQKGLTVKMNWELSQNVL